MTLIHKWFESADLFTFEFSALTTNPSTGIIFFLPSFLGYHPRMQCLTATHVYVWGLTWWLVRLVRQVCWRLWLCMNMIINMMAGCYWLRAGGAVRPRYGYDGWAAVAQLWWSCCAARRSARHRGSAHTEPQSPVRPAAPPDSSYFPAMIWDQCAAAVYTGRPTVPYDSCAAVSIYAARLNTDRAGQALQSNTRVEFRWEREKLLDLLCPGSTLPKP